MVSAFILICLFCDEAHVVTTTTLSNVFLCMDTLSAGVVEYTNCVTTEKPLTDSFQWVHVLAWGGNL